MPTENRPLKPDEILICHASEPPAPSEWVARWLANRAPGHLLDLACGSGRHARWAAARGHQVLAIDRDAQALDAIRQMGSPTITIHCEDLEAGPWSLAGQSFDVIVCTNYLFRPRLALLLELLAPGGLWIHETFAMGNEAYGRPRNPDFLLREGELMQWANRADLQVIAFESGLIRRPGPAVIQRIAAVRSHQPQAL